MRNFLIHTYAFAYRNAVFAKRNVFVVVEMLFWPIMTVLSIGLMGNFLELGDNTLSYVMTGAIAAGVLQVTQLDVGYSLLYDLWSKSVKHTYLSPAGVTPPVLGAWGIGIVRGLIVLVVLVYLSLYAFGFEIPSFWMLTQFALGVFWMSLLAGIFVWILILMYGQRAEISVWALSYVVMLLCGVYYPVSYLPEPFLTMAKWIPLTYFLDAFRFGYGFERLFQNGLVVGWILNIVYMFIGLYFVKLAVSRARKTGMLLRLSE